MFKTIQAVALLFAIPSLTLAIDVGGKGASISDLPLLHGELNKESKLILVEFWATW